MSNERSYPIVSTLLSALAIGIAISVIMGQPPQGHPKKPVCRLVLNPWDASLRTRERERERERAMQHQPTNFRIWIESFTTPSIVAPPIFSAG
jgi:hypothetical protein